MPIKFRYNNVDRTMIGGFVGIESGGSVTNKPIVEVRVGANGNKLAWSDLFTLNFSFSQSESKSGRTTTYTQNSNSPSVPRACTLYLETVSQNSNIVRTVNINGSTTSATTFNMSAGDTIQISLRNNSSSAYTVTLRLRLNDSNGAEVGYINHSCRGTSTSSCYLTSAMVEYFNLEDDGVELTALRLLRAERGEFYKAMLLNYYSDSEHIIRFIEDNKRYDLYDEIRAEVDKIVEYVANEYWAVAEQTYLHLYLHMKNITELGGVDFGNN